MIGLPGPSAPHYFLRDGGGGGGGGGEGGGRGECHKRFFVLQEKENLQNEGQKEKLQ